MSRTQPPRTNRESSLPKRNADAPAKEPEQEVAPAPPLGPPNPAGKYALLEVPSFADDPERGTPMTSFVRLGVPNRHHELDGGSDLLATAKGVGWESNLVDTRGGLRDHSDGDRVSTTRGHKIDVISGNYKKVLASDKASGGSVREDHAHENGVLTLDTKKANVIERTVTHGERYETFTGPKLERNTGVSRGTVINDAVIAQVQRSTTKAQAENQPPRTNEPPRTNDQSGSPDAPSVENEQASTEDELVTAADDEAGESSTEGGEAAGEEAGEEAGEDVSSVEQETSVGNTSELNAGLVMNSQTFALAINETTGAATIGEQTLVGRADSMTLAGSLVETTWAGEIHSVTSAMLLAEATNAAVATSTTQVGILNEATLAGVILSDTKAGALFETTFIPLQTTLNVGDSIDVRVGNQLAIAGPTAVEVWVGAFTEVFGGVALSLRLAASAEITIGAGAELFVGATAEVFLGVKLEVTVARVIELAAGGKIEVGGMDTITAGPTLTSIQGTMKKIATALHMGA